MHEQIESIIQYGEAEEGVSAVRALNAFTTKIWMNPLVNDELIAYRERAHAYVSKYKDEPGVLLIPVGGSIWNKGKDVDYLVLFDESVPEKFEDELKADLDPRNPNAIHCASYRRLNQKKFSFTDITLDEASTVRNEKERYMKLEEWMSNDLPSIATLFLTPDELIVGDRNYLKELRVRALNENSYIRTDGQNPFHNFEEQFMRYLNLALENIKAWPKKYISDNPDIYNIYFERYWNPLFRRGAKTRAISKYMETFERKLEELAPPPFNIIKSAIEVTEGEIHIDPRYVARNQKRETLKK